MNPIKEEIKRWYKTRGFKMAAFALEAILADQDWNGDAQGLLNRLRESEKDNRLWKNGQQIKTTFLQGKT